MYISKASRGLEGRAEDELDGRPGEAAVSLACTAASLAAPAYVYLYIQALAFAKPLQFKVEPLLLR